MKSQFTLLLTILVWMTATVGKCPDDCSNIQNSLYESFHCIPICGDNDDCPISYDCSIIHQHNDTCFYNGKHYRNGETANDLKTRDSCLLGCKCRDNGDNNTEFICYVASCAVPPLPFQKDADKCIFKRILGDCCPTGRICPPFRNCTLEGKIFEETEIDFDHPNDSCQICTCDRGEGSEGIIKCEKRYCGDLIHHQEVIRRMCAPFYYNQDDCCPSTWICPEDKISFDQKSHGDDGPTCLFGDKILKKNQKFYSDNDMGKVLCECILPPFASCSLLSSN